MYCKHCGKEIADDSKFCQHCGGKQTKESVRCSRWNDFIVKHKKLSYAYLMWLAYHIFALAIGMANPHRHSNLSPYRPIIRRIDRGEIDTSGFFPFNGNLSSYDLSEFIVYTIAMPLFLFAMIKLCRLFVPQKSSN